jgi:GxxExxY protein
VSRAEDLNHEGHEGHEALAAEVEALGRVVVDAGLSVHKALGPGLLESAYEHCLAFELAPRGVAVRRQVALPIVYRGSVLAAGYRLDLLVGELVIIEVKAIDALTRLNEAQVLTYLKLSKLRLGYLMNFNVDLFKQGLRRIVL